ncbi:unnamed protein product [Schistosoma mattheei]|uniref:Uncharacterized protein n=1 Tax=Schistosoma mattheei TaxID=31246 RepID=A0A183PBZ1_9TREM|nr:unnamed protein product [Schistosoma mattheei]
MKSLTSELSHVKLGRPDQNMAQVHEVTDKWTESCR